MRQIAARSVNWSGWCRRLEQRLRPARRVLRCERGDGPGSVTNETPSAEAVRESAKLGVVAM